MVIAGSAVQVVLVVVGVWLSVMFASRVFAFLGVYVDQWRPTPPNQARVGHDALGVGIVCLFIPIGAVVWYELDKLLAHAWREPEVLPVLALFLVLLITPLGGVISLLRWKYQKVDLSGDHIRATDVFGRQSTPLKVLKLELRPPIRGPGRVGFQVGDGWIFADTSWINIRPIYEELAGRGVPADPWRERTS